MFSQRDFVSASGYAATDRVIVQVTHPDGTKLFSDANIVPQDDPKTAAFDGIIEVNHPGGACWVGNTPNIRPGDKVSITVNGVPGADETTVAKVAGRLATNPSPGTIQIHGTAADANGNPIPIDELEQLVKRLGAKGLAWAKVEADKLNSPIEKFLPAGVQQNTLEALARLNEERRRLYPGESELEARLRNYELAKLVNLNPDDEVNGRPHGMRSKVVRCLYPVAEGGAGMVPVENLIGRATVTFWSTDGSASYWKPWTWFTALRGSRVGNGYTGDAE